MYDTCVLFYDESFSSAGGNRRHRNRKVYETGYVFPKKKVIICLAPSDKKKSGSHFDLAMAVGVLYQNEDISAKNLSEYGFIGELSLDGRLRACRGILPMIIAAQKSEVKKLIVPNENLNEAKLVRGIEIVGLDNLYEVIKVLEGKEIGIECKKENRQGPKDSSTCILDFAEVKG